MTEEQVTKEILRWLDVHGWDVVSFDFPQSGTGQVLRPTTPGGDGIGAIIPDIVAAKEKQIAYFENKDRVVSSDFEKVSAVKQSRAYDEAFSQMLGRELGNSLTVGIGFPESDDCESRALPYMHLVDFVVVVGRNGLRFLKGGL